MRRAHRLFARSPHWRSLCTCIVQIVSGLSLILTISSNSRFLPQKVNTTSIASSAAKQIESTARPRKSAESYEIKTVGDSLLPRNKTVADFGGGSERASIDSAGDR